MLYQSLIIESVFKQDQLKADGVVNNTNSPAAIKANSGALEVYHNNYVESGIRALSVSYSTVLAMLDESDFRKLAIQYIKKHPKTCFDWADYGENLADFMFEIEELSSMPFLPEIAEIDWSLMHIERAPTDTFDGTSFGLLQTHSMDDLRFVAAPGLTLTEALFPLAELYLLARDDSESDASTESSQKKLQINKINNLVVNAINSPVYRSIVLWREDFKGMFEYCDSASAKAFKSMLKNKVVSEVLGHFGDDQNAMTHWLQHSIQTKKIYAVVATK